MPRASHPFDGIADEVTSWMDTEVDWYADALKSGYQAPFSAPTNEAEKKRYYLPQVFKENPDGSIDYQTPNEEGRAQLLKRLGTKGYAEVIAGLMPKNGRPPTPTAFPEPPVPTDELDEGI